MFKQDASVVATAIRDHWGHPDPIVLDDSLVPGVSADVWLATTGDGRRYVAKFVYGGRAEVEAGLAVAEQVARRTGLLTGTPCRTRAGELTVMLPSVPGQRHPLALLEYVDGRPATPGGDLTPERAAALLARVHQVVRTLDTQVPDGVLAYLADESVAIAYEEQLRPVIRRALARVQAIDELSWGTCYGDGPEAIELTDGRLALVDWGGVVNAPVLWDVACWAHGFAAGRERDRFVEHYLAAGPLPATELTHLDRFLELRDVQQLRFRAHRVLHADHYTTTAAADAVELTRLAAGFGVALS